MYIPIWGLLIIVWLWVLGCWLVGTFLYIRRMEADTKEWKPKLLRAMRTPCLWCNKDVRVQDRVEFPMMHKGEPVSAHKRCRDEMLLALAGLPLEERVKLRRLAKGGSRDNGPGILNRLQ